MKKKYCKPAFEVVELLANEMLALSIKYTNDAADKNSEVLSGEHRGDWGCIWEQN